MKTKLLLSALIFLSFQNLSKAADGTISFTGSIVDSVCSVSMAENGVGCIKDIQSTDANGNTVVTQKFEKAIDVSEYPKNVGEVKTFDYEGNKASIQKIVEDRPLYEMTVDLK